MLITRHNMFKDDLPLAILVTTLGWPIQVALVRCRTAYIPKDAVVGEWGWEWEYEGGRDRLWYRDIEDTREPTEPTAETEMNSPEWTERYNLGPLKRPGVLSIMRATKETEGWMALYRGLPLMILALVAKANTMPLLLTILPDSLPVFTSVVVLQILLEILVPIFEIRLCVVLFMLKNLGFFGMDGDIASLLKSRDIDLRASPIWARVFMVLSTVFLVPFRIAIARVSAYEPEDKKDDARPSPSWPLSPPPRPAHLSREMVLAVYPTIVMEEGWGALWAGWGWTALWRAIEPF